MRSRVPQEILEFILKEAAALANVTREQLVILRAEPVIWNDGTRVGDVGLAPDDPRARRLDGVIRGGGPLTAARGRGLAGRCRPMD